ncbi:dihydropteroate synthase [Fulvitalea axinellae]|uniref:dihydropteroate synthase n=1 Tax=Fulvitalea axinellae TaxID=1182444 RepID=A0AAU9C7F4_9BACT|nr:dihydropteroate synthase [Fulvitalea axinellae]
MTKDTAFYQKKVLKLNGKPCVLEAPQVMGIINATPDSFYEGSRTNATEDVVRKAGQMLEEGAFMLDVGGYSTRPGADDIPAEEEKQRVCRAVEAIKKEFAEAVISVDTFRADVAKAAVEAGASVVNDVSGGTLDDAMYGTVANLGVPYIMMHMRGTPQNMQDFTEYGDIVRDIIDFFHPRIHRLRKLGVNDIILDPGFGFSKTLDQNFELLRRMKELELLECPVLAGVSRKSMIWKTLDITASEALNGTTATHAFALANGAKILRAHDVKEAVEAVKIYMAMSGA